MFGGLKKKRAWLHPRLFMAAAIFFMSTPAQAQDITTGLVGYWNLDENAGISAADSSGNTNTGTLTNGPGWAAGQIGSAVQFNGTNQYIDHPMSGSLNINSDEVTISAWINADTTGGGIRRILSAPGNEASGWEKYSLLINAGLVQFWVGRPGPAANNVTTPFSAGSWHHVAGVYDGADIRIYVDGMEANSAALTGNIINSTNGNFQIGRYGPTYNQHFDGLIDEVRVYNRALSAADITALYNYTGSLPCNAAYAGVMLYNEDKAVLQYCNSTDWIDMGPKNPVVTGCTNPGDECDDGSVYAGLSPDGNTPMFTTHCDAGQTWDGSACTGVATLMTWKDDTFNGNYTTTNITSNTTGEQNTASLILLDANSGTGGVQPHDAAQYCADLSADGYDDWYLPAMGELTVFYTNRVAIGNFGSGTFYWSSSEADNTRSHIRRFTDGTTDFRTKNTTYAVRCARKQSDIGTGACTNPDGVAGEVNYNYTHAVMQYCNGANWINMGPIIAGSSPVPTTGLVAHWPLDEVATPSADVVGGYNGTWTGTVTSVAGINGTAQNLNNAYLSVGDIPEIRNIAQLTLSAWMKRDAPNSLVQIGKQGSPPDGVHGVNMEFWSDTMLYCSVSDGTAYQAGYVVMNDTNWHHVTMVFDGTQTGNANRLKCYVDGVEQTLSFIDTIPAVTTNDTGPFHIGRLLGVDSDGSVDDVRLYNVALTAVEVQSLYAGSGGSPSTPTGCTTVGDECSDGTVYAGISPDGNIPMYTTHCSYGATWNGTTCSSTGTATTWNNGNSTGQTTTGATSNTDGDGNTAAIVALDSDSGTGGTQPHIAAQYCANLVEGGHSDWYLPAMNEVSVLYNGHAAIGNFFISPGSHHWSSSEDSTNNARVVNFTTGVAGGISAKDWSRYFRCVRKGAGASLGSCSSPAGVAGEMVYNADNDIMQYCNGTNWVGVR